jgi:hypothetical protein
MSNPVLALGVINLLLIAFQILSGLRLIRVRLKYHRISGMALLLCAALHAGLAMGIFP